MTNETKILRQKQVQSQTALSRSTIYARMKEGTFPQSIKIGTRSVRWLKSDIDQFIENCVAQSRAQQKGGV